MFGTERANARVPAVGIRSLADRGRGRLSRYFSEAASQRCAVDRETPSTLADSPRLWLWKWPTGISSSHHVTRVHARNLRVLPGAFNFSKQMVRVITTQVVSRVSDEDHGFGSVRIEANR